MITKNFFDKLFFIPLKYPDYKLVDKNYKAHYNLIWNRYCQKIQ